MRDYMSVDEMLNALRDAHDKWRANRGGIGFACFMSELDQERAFAKADNTFAQAVAATLRTFLDA